MRILRPFPRSWAFGVLAWLLTVAGGALAPASFFRAPGLPSPLPDATAAVAAAASVGTPGGVVELSPAPVNLIQAVSPNIVVTFDDSGSMANDYMGDTRPFDGKSWSGHWQCAGVIDPRSTDATDLRSAVMNGVYYNPNVVYTPPVEADGSVMPNADATLKAVWTDGIAQNRPYGRSNASTTNFTGKWVCPGDSSSPFSSGPYYWRLKSTVNAGTLASPNTSTLYNAGNWEAVAVANSTVTIGGQQVNQWQNWANWYAYYRTRSLMARTSISRVFGAIANTLSGGGYGTDIRAAWQNLDSSDYQLPTSAIITSLIDATGCSAASVDPLKTQTAGKITVAPSCYRSAFFNWIFGVGASGGTPSRSATIRAGEFFKRGNGNKGATGDLTDPYWEPGKDGAQGNELVCRQNFHMLVTDGMWNDSKKNAGDETLTGGWSDKSSGLVAPIPQTATTLPDGQAYDPNAAVSRIFNGPHDKGGGPSMADIAFHYWATDLRDDLYKKPDASRVVAPYMPDSTTGVTASASAADGGKSEIYFNPANDPANWPHLVQYLVGLGVNGTLTYSTDIDCTASPTSDLCKLRKGQLSWPQPNGTQGTGASQGSVENIDDTWLAALEGRGQFFSAGNPQNLVDQLTKILTSITARSAQPQTSGLNTSVLTQGALSFETGYSSSDWSGVFQAVSVDANGQVDGNAQWDAGAILDKTDPAGRQILTSTENGDGHFNQGVAFRNFGSLDNNSATGGSSYVSEQAMLAGSPASADGGARDTGQARLDYLRGTRTLESSVLRVRGSVLGAIINSQVTYVTYPDSGYLNTWPDGSPEAQAAASGQTYEQFVQDHLNRRPTAYVGANDGMLHAFDASLTVNADTGAPTPTASSGQELFAYVPRAVFPSLGNLTSKSAFTFAPTVDATPVTRDVYFANAGTHATAGWHTILVGGLRGGGRGAYALDITDPTQVTEANASSKVLWEFNADTPASDAGDPANLGYTYGQPNIARLASGQWVVLLPGGYFPDCSKPDQPPGCKAPAAYGNYSSLFVLDAQSGTLIKELRTPTDIAGVASAGLSSPVLGDYEGDQVDDVAFAGDLNGNLWRFDLTAPDPANWKATLAYKPDVQGEQPITSMPRLFPEASSGRFVVIFGTGKYLGAGDNTSVGAAVQSVYGIHDPGAGGATVTRASLLAQTMGEAVATDGEVARTLTDNQFQAEGPSDGWYFDLDLPDAQGERVVVTPTALFDSDRVIITTLIPGTSDPCSASIQGALLVVDAGTGGSGSGLSNPTGSNLPAGYKVVGTLVNNPPTSGSLPVASAYGGGKILAPGLSGAPSIDAAIWRRRSWRVLSND